MSELSPFCHIAQYVVDSEIQHPADRFIVLEISIKATMQAQVCESRNRNYAAHIQCHD